VEVIRYDYYKTVFLDVKMFQKTDDFISGAFSDVLW
jgi:hypothetical protein